MRAHPRSRGENWRASVASRSPTGSSPLTRGKHPLVRGTFAVGGLIPAHAGKTGRGQDPRRKRGAHPRSRGENTANQASAFCDPGSSPLTRGKRRSAISALLEPGLIPAHAGKTARHFSVTFPSRAHPRSRGENDPVYLEEALTLGSSPLTRGKHSVVSVMVGVFRLIPAHAGKTLPSPTEQKPNWAHPRSRGENCKSRTRSHPRTGSSPLTRGKQVLSESHTAGLGLIPAHAGKTVFAGGQGGDRRAHPRSRGENSYAATIAVCFMGSSPLTRGKQSGSCVIIEKLRLIPAHAGKTRSGQ